MNAVPSSTIVRVARIALLLVVGFFIVGAHALTANSDSGIAYITGGATIDERDEMRGQRKDFSLLLKLAARSGKYLGASAVSVKNASGATTFECTTDGPWLLVNMPPGNYTITVNSGGVNQLQRVNIGKHGRRELTMYWNVIDKDDTKQ